MTSYSKLGHSPKLALQLSMCSGTWSTANNLRGSHTSMRYRAPPPR
eukprot:CAMPEP_0114650534 /NCGR_PEP_ID=MMETSP0191-20121206/7731_1 /TAXON_ID=126664 /ORGANISM="Sorites sp." /LENGTH=45 /DNA_ID= /DNA_START= /DNA_END= /DNA_ORIENTATION=